jgi:hypothetical protein
MSLASTRRVDPELGPEKLCTTCGEWWPLDEEFWYLKRYRAGDVETSGGRTYVRQTSGATVQSRCRACWAERSARQYAERKSS